uniref:Uncharacterized protein n=1 Tax=Coccidioides posadasii RMSCC 3488 TaxID=454284 RepID=A0A0J6IGB1_COCPO|nr:hypothetical protein CPAG_07168 [Coccidioides posadasii RMSCC 3488]
MKGEMSNAHNAYSGWQKTSVSISEIRLPYSQSKSRRQDRRAVTFGSRFGYLASGSGGPVPATIDPYLAMSLRMWRAGNKQMDRPSEQRSTTGLQTSGRLTGHDS